MPPYDPYFWEISVDPESMESMSVMPDFLEELTKTPEDIQDDEQKEILKQEAVDLIKQLIQTDITPKQRQIVELYFYENKSQQEIAETLNISQQVVSKHLFGAVRNGRRVGGAMAKLRKLCIKSGIDPKKWV
jgi:RNA polymerase sigma factor (sigma-70 family)